MIEDGLVAKLYASPAIAGLVGGVGIYPAILPQNANLPALVYMRVSDVTEVTMDAYPVQRLVRSRFQFQSWARNYGQCIALRRAVLAALVDFVGALADNNMTVVRDITPDTSNDTFDTAGRNWRNDLDLIVWYWEPYQGQGITIGGGGGVQITKVPFVAPAPAGNFSWPHGLGKIPQGCMIAGTSAGAIWFQPLRFDSTNVYLVSSEAGLTGELEIYS